MKKTTLRQNVKAQDRQWYVVDAATENLGRLATRLSRFLMGKHRPDYTPHVDGGDYIVVLNAGEIQISGNKETDKMYSRHSGYLGGLKQRSLKTVRSLKPEQILRDSVAGMLPKNRLRDARIKRLLLVTGSENPHAAQNPQPLP